MSGGDIAGLVITSAIGLICLIMSVVMIAGRGESLIAGFNSLSKKEREKCDGKRLSRFMGFIMLPISIMFPLISVCVIFGVWWFPILFVAVIVALLIFAIIYVNTGNRFKK